MIQFDLPKQKSSIIKVLGVGGGGSNAVNYMYSHTIEGVDFIICNTDSKAIEQSKIPNKIQLGPHLTQGLGAGANPEVGKQATEESLEEIKRILEVNTKMAFICAGMGGGTGTGGAPIISKICRELGILTVGIVTTPFGFEGPRRMKQAEDGIAQLKPYVDTLLVISNDKLRVQYGNLKMKEAFAKADNVLATAAKCITDIINSKGHIIVDFADVCTVMKNGGVAILGSAAVDGENRAQLAIEEALSSPLLNDNDIRGAKWLLININSPEGEFECTMDEVETIQNHLRMQTGEDTDVIMGMGNDNDLGEKLSITVIATGFEHKDPFKVDKPKEKAAPAPEKIIMTLGMEETPAPKAEIKKEEPVAEIKDELTPTIATPEAYVVETPVETAPPTVNDLYTTDIISFDFTEVEEPKQEKVNTDAIEMFTLEPEMPAAPEVKAEEPKEEIKAEPIAEELQFGFTEKNVEESKEEEPAKPFLAKPSNIYADIQQQQQEPAYLRYKMPDAAPKSEEEDFAAMELVVKNIDELTPSDVVENTAPVMAAGDEDLTEAEEQRKRAQERIQKLRNLSFNMNSNDANSEFDNVPAYVRRNMELFGNTLTSVENFYSKYHVNKDENTGQGNISSLNTFLDGNKPD